MTEQMGTLLARMTEKTSEDIKFDSEQVDRMIEILVPTIITDLPGMPKGMKVSVKKDKKGWNIRVDKP